MQSRWSDADAKAAIENHGGQIVAASEVGKGTTVSITLPSAEAAGSSLAAANTQ